MTNVIRGGAIFIAMLIASTFCTPPHTVVRGDSGREYQVTKVAGLVVGDGSRVLRITFLADSIEDHDAVRQAARDLLPHIRSQAEQGEFDAIAFSARHDRIRVGTCYRADTYTVIYQKTPEADEWVLISPAS